MISHKIKAVIWDIDGTLIDSEPHHLKTLIEVSRDCGADLDGVDERTFLGLHTALIWEALNRRRTLQVSEAEWRARMLDYYVVNAGNLMPRPGAPDLVARAAERNLRQAAVSNSGRAVIAANLARLPGAERLEFAISREDVANPKPAPDSYALACSRLGLDPGACLAVEDSPAGVTAAKGAGMLAVAWPEYAELRFPDADVVVDSADAVLKAIEARL